MANGTSKRKHEFTTETKKEGKKGRSYNYCRYCGKSLVGRAKSGECKGKAGE